MSSIKCHALPAVPAISRREGAMSSIARRILSTLILCLAIATPAVADVVYIDSTFNLADYVPSAAYSSDADSSIIYGSSAGTLKFTSTFDAPAPPFHTVAQGLINSTFAYDPSTHGAILSIGASVLKNITTDFSSTGLGNTFRPAILQDGTYYLAAVPGPTFTGPNEPGGTGYQLLSNSSLVASDFVDFNFATGTFGASHPDFGGDTILLGLTQITGVGLNQRGYILTQYQNLGFDIRSVREPGSLALLAVSLLGILLLQRPRARG